jgi:hypothetical protein
MSDPAFVQLNETGNAPQMYPALPAASAPPQMSHTPMPMPSIAGAPAASDYYPPAPNSAYGNAAPVPVAAAYPAPHPNQQPLFYPTPYNPGVNMMVYGQPPQMAQLPQQPPQGGQQYMAVAPTYSPGMTVQPSVMVAVPFQYGMCRLFRFPSSSNPISVSIHPPLMLSDFFFVLTLERLTYPLSPSIFDSRS